MLWLLCLTLAAWGQPSLSVQGNVRQGGVLFVRVRDLPEGVEARAKWAGRTFSVSPQGETVLPVPADREGGRQTLAMELSDGTRLERELQVQSRPFPLQTLSLNPDTLASYDDPQNKRDDQLILASMKEFDPQKLWSGNFDLPVEAPETTGFGLKRLYNGWKKGWHKGLDLGGWEGQPVEAPAAGMVLHNARGVVNGNTVVLGHGLGVGTVYLHLQRSAVRKGQRVEKGEVIGYVGGTGGFSPHLHWEARVQGVPVDPKTFRALPADWR